MMVLQEITPVHLVNQPTRGTPTPASFAHQMFILTWMGDDVERERKCEGANRVGVRLARRVSQNLWFKLSSFLERSREG